MALARRIDMDDAADAAVSNDARRRIDTARVRQLAFEVQKVAPAVTADDAEMLAALIIDTVDAGLPLDGAKIRAGLREKGRSPDAADKLARLIGL